MSISVDQPIGEIAIERLEAVPVLERFGIDHCCGGEYTLAETYSNRELQAAVVANELEHQQKPLNPRSVRWEKVPLKELAEHIVKKHHTYTRKQLELIGSLADKVERRHGMNHPELFQISTAVDAIRTELIQHFVCEESILFPYIAQLGAGDRPALPPVFSSMEQPIERMMDHDHTGSELYLLREITNNYQPPADACLSYRALYRALEDLEQDLHWHIHLENNILFPRALEQAKERE